MLRRLVLIAALIAPIAGCGNTNRTPRYNVPEALEVETFKRSMKHPSVDYFYNFKETAYNPVNKPITKRLSPSQKDLLERHGQPDWSRRTFTATTDEKVSEWVWWDRSIIAQFVQNELVFEGPLTDMDRHRIKHGLPRRAWVQDYEDGVSRDIWEYQRIGYNTGSRLVTFTDETLVSEQSY